jgi:hypothetical protein
MRAVTASTAPGSNPEARNGGTTEGTT